MASQVQPILVKLGIEGYEELAKLKSAFRGLDTTVKQSDATLSKARESLLKYGKGAQQSEALFQGMVSALEGLKAQADVTGPTFRQLERDITQYGESLRGSTMAQERQRTSLLAMARGASTSAAELRSVIRGLQDLQKGARPGSSAFVQLGRDIDTLQSRLRGLSEESRAFRSVLGQALSAKADTMVRQLENFRRVLADSASTAEQLATALRQVELLSVGEARSGLQRRADVFSSAEGERFFAQLRRTYEDLPKTQSIISQRINEVNTELQNVTGYERRRALTQELIRLNKELRNAVVEVTTAEQFAAMGLRQQIAARRAASGGGGFGAFSAEITQRAAAGRYTQAGQRTQEAVVAKNAADDALQAVKESYQGRVDAANAALNRQVDLEVKAQQEINRRLDTANDELIRARDEEFQRDLQRWDRLIQAADRYANSRAFSKQYLGLQGRELSPFYEGVVGLGVGTSSMQASKYAGRDFGRVTTDVIEAFNLQLSEASRVANEGVGYFREAAIAHAGGSEHVRKILEQWDAASIPENMYPMAGETGDQYKRRLTEGTSLFERVIKAFGISLDKTGDGVERSAEALRQSAIDFAAQEGKGEEVRTALSRYKTAGSIPMYMLPRESVETPGSYAQRIAGTQRPPLPDIGDISKASLTKLQDFKELLQEIRNDIPPIGAEFKKLDKDVAQTVRRIDAEIGKRTATRRGLGAQDLTQIAGAAISGGIFGGPEGLLGGVAGGAFGGVGGSFAGAAIGAQVAMLRQAAGATAEYAAAINQQRRALSGVVEDSAAYQQSLAFIDQTSRALAIPQEQVTRNFTKLSASVLGAGGDVAAAQEAFAGIAAGIRGTGGNLADLDAALLATAQVFSKGKVSAEELRGQIGERLPGAFTLFAESIGKTPAELDKMLEKGQVSLNDFMSFVRLLSSDYGQQALAMAASSEAAGDRLATAFGRMQENVGKAIQPIGAQFQEMFAKFVEGASPVLETALPAIGELALSVAKNIDVIAASIAALAAGALVNAIATTGGLAAAFNSLTTAVMASNAALLLNPWVALAAGITVATVALVKHHNAQREFNDLISSGAGTTGQLKEAQQALEQRLARTKAQLKNVGGGMRDSAGDTKILQDRVKELQMQLDKLKGTYTVRVRLETQGYGGFGDDGMPKTYTVAGVTYDIASGRPITAPKSDVKFPTAPPETAADKTKKGPKPPEDRTLQYQQELVYLKNINEQELGREVLLRQGRDLEAARADMTRRQVEIEYERERALAAANYQGERDAIRAIAAEKLRRSELQYMLDRQKIEKDTFDKRIEANKSVQDAAKPIRDALDARMRELSSTKEYARLIQEGVLPAEANRRIAYKELVQSAIRQQDEELKLLEIKLEQLEASNLSADIAEGERKRIQEQIDLIKRKKKAIESAAASGPGPAETDIDRINAGITAAKGKLNELTNVGNIVVTAANNIGNAFGEAFNKLVTGAGSARQVLSQFFQDVANGFFKMAQEIIAQTLIMITLQAILKALGGATGGGGGGGGGGFNLADFGKKYADGSAPMGFGTFSNGSTYAKGGTFTPQGPVERYAKGGIVNAPTLFRYAKGGTFAPGLMGEAGPEAILPLRRTPDGRLGVTQVRSPQGGDRMREMLGRSPAQQQAPTLNLKFETTTINGVEYVSREQLEVAMAETRKRASKEGAERGMSMTLDKMRNSPRTRAQVGMR